MNEIKIEVNCGCVTLIMIGRSNDTNAIQVNKFIEFAEKFWEDDDNPELLNGGE